MSCQNPIMDGGAGREDRLARNIHSRLGRQHKLRLQGRGKLFLSSVSILCQVILLNNDSGSVPLNISRAIPTQCQVMQCQILFLRTFIIPFPAPTMGLEKH